MVHHRTENIRRDYQIARTNEMGVSRKRVFNFVGRKQMKPGIRKQIQKVYKIMSKVVGV